MASITRSDELRYANRARVLACLRSDGAQSRKQLASSTGISAATVTQVTAQLLDERIIAESSPPDPSDRAAASEIATARRGRPQVVLEMSAEAALVATVIVNYDGIEVTLFDYQGELLQQRFSAIRQARLSACSLLDKVAATLRETLARAPVDATLLRHITVACQGKVSKLDGDLLWSPHSQSQTIAVGSRLQREFGVAVSVDNDCNMIASALYSARWSTSCDSNLRCQIGRRGNFAAVLISYGIGLGLIHEGEILTGSRSSGTELGHMQISIDGPLCRCGKRGCIEAYAADYAIWRRVNGLPADQLVDENIDAQSMADIFAAAHRRDGIERLALREAGAAIGQGLANLFAIFDSFPTRLVGLDASAATFVAAAIHDRLLDSGEISTDDIVSVHSSDSETELIRRGAAMHCLDVVDQQIFSFGASERA